MKRETDVIWGEPRAITDAIKAFWAALVSGAAVAIRATMTRRE